MKKVPHDIIHGALRYSGMVYVLVGLLVALGILGLFRMNKDEFPTFEIKQGLVAAVYPGATAAQVEAQLTESLESLLFSIPEVRRDGTTSVSKDGMCYIFVDVDVSPEKKAETWAKIRLRLDAHKVNLPPGVLAVAVLEDFTAVSAMLIALESPEKGWTEMKHYADELARRLRKIKRTANVSITGTQSEEIAVTVDMDVLSAYGISPSSLMLDYQSASVIAPGGTFGSSPVNVRSTVADEYGIAEKIVWTGPEGEVLRLKDVATVERRFKEPSSFVDNNGNTALIVSVEMRQDNDIVAFGREVDKVLADFSKELPDGVTMSRITDQPQVVYKSVVSFLRDLLISMMVVVLVMLLLFPLRSAMIASSGVPICTAVTIAVMYVTGIPLNTVTLAALIVVLGMIVDDSIITMDGYMDKIAKGWPVSEAAAGSAKELFLPMFMATFAIGAMFFPTKAIITGYLGDFIRFFPWVIAIALATSLLYAIFVVPSLEVRFIGSSVVEKENRFTRLQKRFFAFLQKIYESVLEKCFRRPVLTVMAGAAAVALGIFMFTQLNIQMMPMAARSLFAVEISLESGNTLKDTEEVADSLRKILLSDSRIRSVTSFVGVGAPRFHATYAPITPSPDCAQLIVNTVSDKATQNLLAEYEGRLEHHFPSAVIRFKQMDYQSTTPVAVTFKGGTVDSMKPFADSLRAYMAGMSDRLKWVHGDGDSYVPMVDVVLDPEESAEVGVNKTVTALALSAALDGRNVATIWDGNSRIQVNLYSALPEDSYDALAGQKIPSVMPGISVPLRQVASLVPSWEPDRIPHTAGEQSLTVYADMKTGCSQPEAMKEIRRYMEREIIPRLPEGVEAEYGGLSASNRILVPQIGLSLLFAVLIIFVFMLVHFRKLSLSLLTIVLSSLCLFGAFFGLWVFGLDFSMTAVLGLISLIGIIVRNGIIMFDYAEELRSAKGYDVLEASMEAGKRRMRPIFLTSCTTALGVLPMIVSGDLLWLPMGVVICFGTMLSIVLIVLVMPVSYWLLFRKR